MRRAAAAVAVALACALPAVAVAAWAPGGAGDAYARAQELAGVAAPGVAVSGRNVAVTWGPAPGGPPASGYRVRRHPAAGGAGEPAGGGCAGTVAATSCTEQAVPPGEWRYTVTPVRHDWHGAESPPSAVASVAAPALELEPASVSALPATLTGELSGYRQGQTVSFRLDDPASGPALQGSITPSPVPASGRADVSVTLPAGTAEGSHTVYAVGSAGDVAGAPVTVTIPPTRIATSAWDLRDLSTGTSEANFSDPIAFADGRTLATQAFPASFSATSYVDYELNGPLRPNRSASSVSFSFRFRAAGSASVACFYLEVRRASTGAVLETRGSALAPQGCVTGLTLTTFTVPLASVTSTDIANDLRIRVYGRSVPSGAFTVDQATVAGTSADGAFVLYPDSQLDRANGSPLERPWSLFEEDSAFYEAAANWPTAYAANRYLRFTFPAYVPAGATIRSATLTHSYRTSTAAGQLCNYVEVYAGANLIETIGGPGSDVSCASGNTQNRTDTLALGSVNTPARANSLSVRVYYRRIGTNTRSREDRVRLTLEYVP